MDDIQLVPAKKLLIAFGFVLIVVGVSLMLYFAYLVYQTFQSPQDVPAIVYIQGLLDIKEPLLKGAMTFQTPQGPQPANFEVEISSSVQAMAFMMMGAIIFAIFIGIANALVNGGASIIKAALYKGDRIYRSK